jgi:AbrB family transcriptional regulator, transcriptional pleiotropic regulator of transition state genes
MTDMHDTGIVRRVDELGRIVIPMELRRTLGIHVKDPLAIYVEGERIILAKHHDACALCGATSGEMQRVNDRAVCAGCVEKLQAVGV